MTKKILYALLTMVVVLTGLLSPLSFNGISDPLSPSTALAQSVPGVEPTEEQECAWHDIASYPLCLAYGVSVGLLQISKMFFGLGTGFLNFALTETVVRITTWFDRLSIINIAWSTFRDLANILFIFILIFVAVSIILSFNEGQARRTLARVIIVALLINFSLFFTKVIIDVSNVVTLQFYNAITSIYGSQDSIYNAFTKAFDTTGPDRVAAQGNNSNPNDSLLKVTWKSTLFILLGCFFLLIATFVFFAIALMFVVRFVILIFLCILSPIAFVAYALPGQQGYASKWWNKLIDACIWPPIFMMFLWVIAAMLKSTQGQLLTDARFETLLNGSTALIFQFAVLITFLIASVAVARNAGATSSKLLTTSFGKIGAGGLGFMGRQTLGRGFSNLAKYGEQKGWSASRMGNMALKTSKGLARSNFDVRGIPGVQAGAKLTGTDYGKSGEGVLSGLGFKAKDGYAGFEKRVVDKKEKYAKDLGKGFVFKDKAMEARYKDLEYRNENDRKELEKNNAKALQLSSKGSLTPTEMAERDELLRSQKTIDAAIKEREKEMKGITANPEAAVTRQSAYAENIEKGKLPFLGEFSKKWLVSDADKTAAKKIRESQKKNTQKDLLKAVKEATKELEDEETPKTDEPKTSPDEGAAPANA